LRIRGQCHTLKEGKIAREKNIKIWITLVNKSKDIKVQIFIESWAINFCFMAKDGPLTW